MCLTRSSELDLRWKKSLFVFDTNVNHINPQNHHKALSSATKPFGKYCDASGEHCDETNEEAVSASPFIDDAAGTIIDHVWIFEGFYSFRLFLELPAHGASLGAPSRENINSLKMVRYILRDTSPNSLFLYFACSYTKAMTTIVNKSLGKARELWSNKEVGCHPTWLSDVKWSLILKNLQCNSSEMYMYRLTFRNHWAGISHD